MDDLHRLAGRLDAAAAALAVAARTLGGLHQHPAAFGADAPGRVGDVGRTLHTRWTAALCTREREARQAAARLADTAVAVRGAAEAYAEADRAAQGRLTRGRPAGGER
jgi:hypothetical protein